MDKKPFLPFVPATSDIPEFTLRAVLLGIVMAMIMGAANAYLGLKAGMTIAATYTTAVIGMAVIKAFRGTILEENTARTIGSIGGNVATGAIFTLPAFFIAGVWNPFFSADHYILATIILGVAGVLGIMYVTILRRVLVEDVDLPFPESIAASEIHKSGQTGAGGSGYLFAGIGLGALINSLVEVKVLAAGWQKIVSLTKGTFLLRGPGMNPAYFGVGYIIGPRLSAINFSGGVLAWGLLTPIVAYYLHHENPGAVTDWTAELTSVWKNTVRYIAIGGMLVGAFYTLYKMRNSLFTGIIRSFSYIRSSADAAHALPRTEQDIGLRWSLPTIAGIGIVMLLIFMNFTGSFLPAAVAALVNLFLGFVFAAVSGYLVGIIGVSNNPTSGLTVSVLIIVAFLMVALGMQGESAIAAVLGVAAFTCTSVSVAGEMMQDLKAGHILGCTPWRMQVGDIFGVTAAALVMFLVLSLLHLGDIKRVVGERLDDLSAKGTTSISYEGSAEEFTGKIFTLDEVRTLPPEMQNEILGTQAGFGGEKLSAPQASLMAIVSRGIVEGKTELILILSGMLFGIALIMMQVKSPMLICVGMYLPIDTTFAIFIGGALRGMLERIQASRKIEGSAKESMDNVGILLASGLIAGEALIGLLFAGLAFGEISIPEFLTDPPYLISVAVMALLGWALIHLPLRRTAR